MTQSPSQLDKEMYRLVLISPDSGRCLTQDVNGTAQLPRVAIPKWTRPAQEISRVIEENWGRKVVVLDFFEGENLDSGCAIAELLCPTESPVTTSNLTWCSIADPAAGELRGSELAAVERLIATGTTGRGAFSRLGWLDDAVAWIGSELPAKRFQFTGEFQQFNASASFCLVRLGNRRGPAYWLKAAGEPNLNEFTVTIGLAEHCSMFLPTIVAARQDWNAWVMEDAGSRVAEPLVLSELERVATNLAELQKCTIVHKETLLSLGCFDQRAVVLRSHIPDLVEYMIHAMTSQTSTRTPRVGEQRLREIGRLALDACMKMESLGIPETLIHNDFTLDNILINDARCVFTDWAEGCVGNPLLTYQHLRAYIAHDERAAHWLPGLDGLYKKAWSDVLSEPQVDRALMLSPLLSLASHLYGRGTWLGPERSENPHLQRYARGLARHMDTAATPDLSGVLCS